MSRATDLEPRQRMDLSDVIPTYNQADLLKEPALTGRSDTGEGCEIVVVDDGSTNHTLAVLREFGPPVKTVRFPTNGVAARPATQGSERRWHHSSCRCTATLSCGTISSNLTSLRIGARAPASSPEDRC